MKDLLRLVAIATTLSLSTIAEAGIESCGNIDIEAQAECEVVGGAECTAKCEPVAFEAACQASLEAECSTTCTDVPTVDCEGSCTGECQTECEVSPSEFSCSADCEASCAGNCAAECEASDDQASCEASCSGRCEGECSASCEGTPVEATCEGKCAASCKGSCEVDLTFSCETECITEGFADCTAELQGGCEVSCEAPEGALFCDGEYVDHGGNLDDCIASLETYLTTEVRIDVEVAAEGTSSCSDNSCEAEGTATCQCAVPGRATSSNTTAFSMIVLGLVGAGLFRRRR